MSVLSPPYLSFLYFHFPLCLSSIPFLLVPFLFPCHPRLPFLYCHSFIPLFLFSFARRINLTNFFAAPSPISFCLNFSFVRYSFPLPYPSCSPPSLRLFSYSPAPLPFSVSLPFPSPSLPLPFQFLIWCCVLKNNTKPFFSQKKLLVHVQYILSLGCQM